MKTQTNNKIKLKKKKTVQDVNGFNKEIVSLKKTKTGSEELKISNPHR